MNEINEGIEKVKNRIEQAYHPTLIQKQAVSKKDLKELGDNEQIVIHHPLITGLLLKIRREFKVETMINMPVVFYGKNYIIEDTGDRVFPQHEVLYNEEEMATYIKELLTAPHTSMFYYIRSLARKGLKVGNVIEFEDGKKGVIAIPEGDSFGRNLVYIPLKKDGTLSNFKPRLLYGNDVYQKIKEHLEGKGE